VSVTTRVTPAAPVDAAPAAAPGVGRDRRDASGPLAAGVAVALVLAGTMLANPILVLLGLVGATTVLVLRRLPIDVAVPAAVLSLTTAAIAAGLVADVTGVDLLARPWLLTALYVTTSVGVLLASLLRPAPRPGSPFNRGTWPALLPVAVAVLTALIQAFSLDVAKSWSFWGSDLARHMTLIGGVQQAGALDYGASGYPQGLHMLAALVSVPGAPLQESAALLGYDLRLTASLTWLTTALLLWTGVALTIRLGHRAGLSGRVAAGAALALGGVALLMNSFVNSFIYLGAAPSLLAVVVMWALPLAALARTRWVERFAPVAVASAVAVALLAHLWQALMLVPVAALAVVAVPRLGGLATHLRSSRSWRVVLSAVPSAVVALALAAPPVMGVRSDGGTALAGTLGALPSAPWWVLAPGLLGTGLLVRRLRDSWARLLAGSVLGFVGVTAVMLYGAGNGFDISQYYPMKTLWFLAIFLGPLAALTTVAGALAMLRAAGRLLDRAGPAARVLRITTAALTLAVVGAFWLPLVTDAGLATRNTWHGSAVSEAAARAGWANWSAQRYDIALAYGSAHSDAVVVPHYVGSSVVFDRDGTRLVSEVLTFLTGQPELTSDRDDVCEKIDLVAGASAAVVISKLPSDRVRLEMAREGCAGRAPVVLVPGGIRDADVGRAQP
jgi:hypothetical protein